MNDFEQFRQTFFEECDELLQKFEEVASRLTPGMDDLDELNDMFRSVHSIKAGAGAFKLDRLVNYAHKLENVMDQLRSGELTLQADDPDLIVQAGDVLHVLVERARAGEEADAGVEDEVLSALEVMSRGGAEPVETAAESDAGSPETEGELAVSDFKITFRPLRAMYETANEPQLLIAALKELGELECDIKIDEMPPLANINPLDGFITWTLVLRGCDSIGDIEEIFEFVEGDCELSITPFGQPEASTFTADIEEGAAVDVSEQTTATLASETTKPNASNTSNTSGGAPAKSMGSIRVDLDRVDRLVDMVGELVIAQAMALEGLSEQIGLQNVNQLQALEDLTMRTRELQEGVMAIRMQPIKTLFSRFPRIVRDLAKKLDKSVRLELDGELTEVDKTIIEELSDPLTHMIRNCLDHGLETPDERESAGKPTEGVVTLSAEQRNGRILIKVADDGRGLNTEKVLKRAIERGIVSEDDNLTKEEIEALIFQPGFSTASAVSDVSGRGVGMDVVRRNIQKLGGRVTVDSEMGKGSCITLALPLTLAVLDGMLVGVAQEKFVIPLSSILETVCPEPQSIRKMPDGGSVVSLRGEAIRLIDLTKTLNLSRNGQPEPLRKLVVIVENEVGRQVGIIVDEMLGQQQVVIKSLETNFHAIKGVAGTAILGDGRVRLILDIDGLAESNRSPSGAKQPPLDIAIGDE